MERCSGFSADLKGSQDIDRWSLQKAAPLPSCAGTLVTKQGQASTGRLAKASTYSIKSNLARRANWLIFTNRDKFRMAQGILCINHQSPRLMRCFGSGGGESVV